MRRFYRLAAWTLSLLAAVVLVGASWLIVSPPALLSVGSGYAAKIVCSSAFISGRDPDEVLAEDVQAPGHPLLKLMRQDVDLAGKTVTTRLLGLFAPGYAVWHEGFGCTGVPDGDFEAARQAISDVALPKVPPVDPAVAWPDGEAVTEDARVAAVLADPKLAGPGMRAIVVVHDGRIVAEAYADGFSKTVPLLGWSMTKTVNAALIGRLMQAGALTPDMNDLFPEWRGDTRSKIKLAQLLAMESGLAFNESYGSVADVTRMLFLEPDMSRFVLSLPLEANPGEALHLFERHGGASLAHLDGRAQRAQPGALPSRCGRCLRRSAWQSAVMEPDETGIFVGSSYMYATARDWARASPLFLLDDGVWKGNRLLPAGFVGGHGDADESVRRRLQPYADLGEGPGATRATPVTACRTRCSGSSAMTASRPPSFPRRGLR